MEKAITAIDVLLLDELNYVKFNQEESELLFKVIAERSDEAAPSLRRICLSRTGQKCLPMKR